MLTTIRAIKLGPKRHAGTAPPAFKLELGEAETIVGVEHHWHMGRRDRKTDDHYLTVWVVEEANA